MSLHPTYILHPTSYNFIHYRSIIERYEASHPTEESSRHRGDRESPPETCWHHFILFYFICRGGSIEATDYNGPRDTEGIVSYLLKQVSFLQSHASIQSKVLVDVRAVDHPSKKKRLEVVHIM
jgi:hypothetical protein